MTKRKSKKLLTFLIPTFNREVEFGRCFNSIKELIKEDDIDYIVLDNNPKRTYTKKLDNVIHKPKLELNDIYGILIKEGSKNSEFLYFLEDDDFVLKRFEEVVEKLRSFRTSILMASFENKSTSYMRNFGLREGFHEIETITHFNITNFIFKSSLIEDVNFDGLEEHVDNDLYLFYWQILKDPKIYYCQSPAVVSTSCNPGRDNETSKALRISKNPNFFELLKKVNNEKAKKMEEMYYASKND